VRIHDDGEMIELHTCAEQVIMEIVNAMMDQGMDAGEAIILIRGSRIPEGRRTTPNPMTDETLTPEYVGWLTEMRSGPRS
jgi:uncharacterized protein YoaH (UPF0181 family)